MSTEGLCTELSRLAENFGFQHNSSFMLFCYPQKYIKAVKDTNKEVPRKTFTEDIKQKNATTFHENFIAHSVQNATLVNTFPRKQIQLRHPIYIESVKMVI